MSQELPSNTKAVCLMYHSVIAANYSTNGLIVTGLNWKVGCSRIFCLPLAPGSLGTAWLPHFLIPCPLPHSTILILLFRYDWNGVMVCPKHAPLGLPKLCLDTKTQRGLQNHTRPHSLNETCHVSGLSSFVCWVGVEHSQGPSAAHV